MTSAVENAPSAANRPYTPWGSAWELWRSRATEVMLSGPAGTGKSRAALEKLHWCAEKYAGMRGLIFRKRRKDLTESGLVTFEDKVLPQGHPAIGRIRREGRHAYHYPNGSSIVIGGLDEPSKVMSTEYDMAFGQESRELEEGDWESVLSRLRNGVMPYQQLLGDTNPDAPHHWIKQRAAKGGLLLLDSRHEENPVYYDRRKGEWTQAGREYLAKLDALTGVRRLRLRQGLWAQAEGLVYDGWDPTVHLVRPFDIPADWTRYWVIDFGYTNPFCFSDDTEILSENGWKLFKNLMPGEKVAAPSMDTERIEWQVPTDHIAYHYAGEMVVGDSGRAGVQFSVTPNHQMVVKVGRTKIKPRWVKQRADALTPHAHLPTSWSSVAGGQAAPLCPAFLGLLISEGYFDRNSVSVVQKKYVNEVRAVLKGTPWKWSERGVKNGATEFRTHSRALTAQLSSLLGNHKSDSKHLPIGFRMWRAEDLRTMLDALVLGDGSKRVGEAKCRYYSQSCRLVNEVQEACCLLGIPSRVCESDNGMWYVSIQKPSVTRAGRAGIKREHYDGMVYCVTVPNGAIVVRRNGRPMVSGNCCQWWAQDHDGRLFMYREWYMTGLLVEDHARFLRQQSEGEPRPRLLICDHDAEDRATLEKHLRMGTVAARKEISPGIQAVAARLRKDGTGKPRMLFFRDALVRVDPSLREARKPTRTPDEFEGYVWDTANNRKKGEVPVDRDNHGMDCVRYLAYWLDGKGRSQYEASKAPKTSIADEAPPGVFGGWG